MSPVRVDHDSMAPTTFHSRLQRFQVNLDESCDSLSYSKVYMTLWAVNWVCTLLKIFVLYHRFFGMSDNKPSIVIASVYTQS